MPPARFSTSRRSPARASSPHAARCARRGGSARRRARRARRRARRRAPRAGRAARAARPRCCARACSAGSRTSSSSSSSPRARAACELRGAASRAARGSSRSCARHTAEALVVDQLRQRRLLAADRARRDPCAAGTRGTPCRARRSGAGARTAARRFPCSSFSVSVAWISATRPGSTPSTPPSAQDGTAPGGGGSG